MLACLLLLHPAAAADPVSTVVTLWQTDFENELGCGYTKPNNANPKTLKSCDANWTVNGDWSFKGNAGEFRVMRPPSLTSNWFVSNLVQGRDGHGLDIARFGSISEIVLGRCVRKPMLVFQVVPSAGVNLATAMRVVSGPDLGRLADVGMNVIPGENAIPIPVANQTAFFFEFNFPVEFNGPSPDLRFQSVRILAERYAAYADPQLSASCTAWQPEDVCAFNATEVRFCVTNTTRQCQNIVNKQPKSVGFAYLKKKKG